LSWILRWWEEFQRKSLERLRSVRALSSWREEGRIPVISMDGRASEVIVEISEAHDIPDQEQISPMGDELLHTQPVTGRAPRVVEARRSQQAV
jgi:hypothetical protein